MRELPEKLPREKAAELLKRALDSIFVHYVHADTAPRTCIVHVVELDAALAVPALGLSSIFRDWLVVVCCELSSVIIGFSPASTEDTASLILVTNGPRKMSELSGSLTQHMPGYLHSYAMHFGFHLNPPLHSFQAPTFGGCP